MMVPPVTAADAAGEAIIIEKLAGLDVPILGEESVADGKIPHIGENAFLSSTPLDGTKEYIKRNDEFTVNIALVEQGVPHLWGDHCSSNEHGLYRHP